MNIRIGNDIRITLTVRGPKNYTRSNVKQIKCFLINECLNECSCCSDCGCKCPIERRFPREPFPQYYTPTPYTLHNCGKPMYFADPWNCKRAYSNFGGHFHDPHWWPEYRGFGITPRKFVDCCYHHHMHHSMDIFHYDSKPIDPWHCDKCAYKAGCCGYTPRGEFLYMADATMIDGENRIQCIFPAKDQIMCGAYKLVLVITTYEAGWGSRNLHTETIDYGTIFTLVDTEDGLSGDIDIDLDHYDPTDNSNVSDIVTNSTSVPAYIFRGDSEIRIGDSDSNGNVYGFNVTTKNGDVVSWNPDTWTGDKFIFHSSNEDVIEIDENGTLTIHDVTERTVVTIVITDKQNQSIVYRFDIAVDPSSGVLPTATINNIDILCIMREPSIYLYRNGIFITITVNGSQLSSNTKVILYEDGKVFDGDITVSSATSTQVIYHAENNNVQLGHTYTYTVYSVDDPTKYATTRCVVPAAPKINSASFVSKVDNIEREFSPINSTTIQLPNTCYDNAFYAAYSAADISNFDSTKHVIIVKAWEDSRDGSAQYTITDAPQQVASSDYMDNLVSRYAFETAGTHTKNFWYTVSVYDRLASNIYENNLLFDTKTYQITVNIDDPDPVVTNVNSTVQIWEGSSRLVREFELNDLTTESTIDVNESDFLNGNAIIRVYHAGVSGTNLNQSAKNEYITLAERSGSRVCGLATGFGENSGDLMVQYTRSNLKGNEIYIQQRCGIDLDYRNNATIQFIDDVSPVIQDAYVDVMIRRGQSIILAAAPIEYADDKSDTDTTILRNTINIGRLVNQLSIDFYHRGVFGQNITNDTLRGIKVLCKLYNNNDEIIGGVTSVGYIEDQRIVSCPISSTDAVRLEATITYLSDPNNIKYTYVFPLTYNYSLDDVTVSYRVYINDEQTQTATNLADGVLSDADNGSTIWLGVPDLSLLPKTLIFEFDYNEVEGTGLSVDDKIITVRHIVKNMQGNIISSKTGSAGVEGSRLLLYSIQPGQFLASQFDIKCGADSDYRTTVFFDRDEDPSLGE